jgi:hypothetical protein
MYALRVTINGKRTIVAGAEDLSVLSAMVTLTGKLGTRAISPRRGKPDLMVRVGGLTSRRNRPDEHLEWLKNYNVKVGDQYLVEIIKTNKVGRIIERRPSKGKAATSGGRAFYKELKEMYLKLKKKYELTGRGDR